jgi:protein-S-isoprenylcysteine O-methyltransferase Ste14
MARGPQCAPDMEAALPSTKSRALSDLAYAAGMIALPPLVIYLATVVLHFDGRIVVPSAELLDKVALPTLYSAAAYAGWLFFQGLLYAVLPGKIELGVPLEDGTRLPYKMNGLSAALLTIALAIGLVVAGVVPGDLLYEHFGEMLMTINIGAFVVSSYMYVLGRAQATPEEKKRGFLEAYFLGAARNPRNGSFDWKFFCESRPGMILWVLINLSFIAAQYERHGTVSASMWMVAAFQILYVIDYFVVEDAILTTWDIRHEPFGWMLCWGCLCWVPMTFALQGLYLVDHPVDLPIWAIVGIVLLNMTGYAIFRGSNLQKHRFRANAATRIWGKPAEFIATTRGTKLLTSGWWGVARHSNYLGDLMMGLAWCLTTGISSLFCYFYIIYFTILLVHRERRDNDHCAAKYGADWERYTKKVRWRILPGVY